MFEKSHLFHLIGIRPRDTQKIHLTVFNFSFFSFYFNVLWCSVKNDFSKCELSVNSLSQMDNLVLSLELSNVVFNTINMNGL